MCLCVLYGSQNKQQLSPYTALNGWFSEPRPCVFIARYELKLYIQFQFIFDVKGIISTGKFSELADLSDVLNISNSGRFSVIWEVESRVVQISCDEMDHISCSTGTSNWRNLHYRYYYYYYHHHHHHHHHHHLFYAGYLYLYS